MFLKVIEGLLAPVANMEGAPALLFPGSAGKEDCFPSEPTEMSKEPPEFPLLCRAGHISSLGPGVSGVKFDQPAINKSNSFGSLSKSR